MAVATYDVVGVALGRSISDSSEQDQIEWWLTGVELFITARLGPVDDLSDEVLAVVQYVEVEAVAGKVRRHGMLDSSITVAVDDGSVTRRFENTVTGDDITDEWWQLLDPDSNAGSASIRPYFEPDTAMWPVRTPGYTDPAFDPVWLTP